MSRSSESEIKIWIATVPKYKFPRENRLVSGAQFRKVYKARNKIISEIFTLYYCDNDVDHPRLGVIVAKRNIKRAVGRNYFKRMVREYFRLSQQRLKNIDVVVVVNKEGKNLSKKELYLLLEKTMNRLNL